jgi:hypothetical protein
MRPRTNQLHIIKRSPRVNVMKTALKLSSLAAAALLSLHAGASSQQDSKNAQHDLLRHQRWARRGGGPRRTRGSECLLSSATVYITHSIGEALLLGDRTAQAGRIKEIIDIFFANLRSLIQLAASAEFGALKLTIWRFLVGELNRARADIAL